MKETDNNNINAPENTEKNKNQDFRQNNNSENNNIIKQNTKDEGNEDIDNEKAPLKPNEKLIQILNNLYVTLNTKENETKDLDEIYEDYLDDEDDKKIKEGISDKCIIIMLIIGVFHLIINLVGIFTIKSIMDTLFDVFFDGLKYFIYKKSELQEYNLTDYKSRYLSSYNFYERFFEHISDNEVEFDLMMFWDFVGMFLQKYCGYSFTYIICFILSLIFLVLIGGFDFLDIDDSSHKYTFFQLLFLILVYLFLWIVVSSLSLLSQQKFITSLKVYFAKKQKEIFQKKKEKKNEELKKEEKEKEKKVEEKNEKNMNDKENNKNDESINNAFIPKKQSVITLNKEEEKKIESESKDDKVEIFFFPILIIIIFVAFLINHCTNREIYKYKTEKMNEIYLTDKNDVYNKMYSKEKNIFLYFVCIPYAGEMILSLIIYFIYNSIFINTKNETEINEAKKNEIINDIKKTEIEEKAIKEETQEIKEGLNKDVKENQVNKEIKLKKVSFKKFCGYIIFKQKIIEQKEIYNNESKGLTRKCCKNFLYCFNLLFISIKECIFKICCSFCSKSCNCCSCCSCCLYNKDSYQLETMNFCLCYQRKRKLKWFHASINDEDHILLVIIIIVISYCQLFILGFEAIYEEKNEKYKAINQRQRSIIIPLIICFVISLIIFGLISLLSYLLLKEKFTDFILKKIKEKKSKFENKDLFEFILFGNCCFIFIIYIFSMVLSIVYLRNKKSVYNGKWIFVPLFLNKFMIFMLYYFLAKQDEKYEVFSNSTFAAFYLFLSELILYAIKALLSIKLLIILQISSIGFLCLLSGLFDR